MHQKQIGKQDNKILVNTILFSNQVVQFIIWWFNTRPTNRKLYREVGDYFHIIKKLKMAFTILRLCLNFVHADSWLMAVLALYIPKIYHIRNKDQQNIETNSLFFRMSYTGEGRRGLDQAIFCFYMIQWVSVTLRNKFKTNNICIT